LERAWEIGCQQLNVDTSRNLVYLTPDWHALFDHLGWVLVPEPAILKRLQKIYLVDKEKSHDLEKEFHGMKQFRYNLVPASTTKEPICRFDDHYSAEPRIHLPPYTMLDALTSHIHPHFVICNAQKMSDDERDQMAVLLGDCRVQLMSLLYKAWTSEENGPSGPSLRTRSATRGSHAGQQSSGQANWGWRHAPLRIEASESSDDSTITEDERDYPEDTTWIEEIYHWQKKGKAASVDGWDPVVVNDGQLAMYVKECARVPDTWREWQPKVVSQGDQSVDTSKFSSNDWAFYKGDAVLTQ
jgi:hypothetical protein